MPRYQVDTTVIDIPTSGAPRTWQADGGGPPPTVYRAIVSVGESNAGGEAPTSSLSAPLQAPTARVQILNVTTGLFENLDIGTNNNLDHFGLGPAFHGWEAGLTTYLDANTQTEPIYYIQTGQGGSQLAQWANGSTYWTKAQTRINQAKARFTALGISPTWEIWFTIGINDFIAGSPISVAAYKAGCIQLIADVRGMIGNGTATRVRTPEFMPPVKTAFPAYCAAHEELEVDVVNCQVVETSDLPLLNDYHWSSAGYITLCSRQAAPT